jgi:hypothetical protein
MYFVYLQKDLKSLFKKTLENKGEVGKKKQKRKRRKKRSHPLETSQPGAAQFSPAHSFSPACLSFSPAPPSPCDPAQIGPACGPVAMPHVRALIPLLFVADGTGPHVSTLSFFLPGESKPVTNSGPNPIRERDFLPFFANREPIKPLEVPRVSFFPL